MSNELTRHQIREKAVQALFQMIQPQHPTTPHEALVFALEAGNDPEAGYQMTIEQSYLEQLVMGVVAHQAEIDQAIEQYLTKNWTLNRVAKIDLAILRLAFYEVLYIEDQLVPNKVAINEAIELAKTYSDEKSRLFINGVLNQLLKAIDNK